jgi:hypothetical protein
MKEEAIEVQGRIQTVLAGTMFRVELDNKHLVLATTSAAKCANASSASPWAIASKWRCRLTT